MTLCSTSRGSNAHATAVLSSIPPRERRGTGKIRCKTYRDLQPLLAFATVWRGDPAGEKTGAENARIDRVPRMREWFHKFAHRTADALGSPWAFAIGVLGCLVWATTGPMFGYSDTWQLVINTSTTVATFLAVFLIQNTQNRDAKAIHLKLDELLRAGEAARTGLVGLERLTDEELALLEAEFERVRARASDRPGGDRRACRAAPGAASPPAARAPRAAARR